MQALDFRGGWTVAALASQLMWVNLFLAGLHSLPAVPFDARAGLHAIVKAHLHAVDQSVILRRMSLFQSHLATCLLGAGLTLFIASLIYAHELLWGCGLMATAIYLLFSSRWELSRACELESDFVPFQARITRRDGPAAGQPGPHRRAAGVKAKSSHSEGNAESEGIPSEPPALDVDDILRKLHRDGRESLSSVESEALISASRELQRKRGTAGK